MIETPRSLNQDGEWDLSVFECNSCGIDFFTQDHVPLTGLPGIDNRKRPRFPALDTVRSRAVLHAISPTRH
jgi:hypothetical protein